MSKPMGDQAVGWQELGWDGTACGKVVVPQSEGCGMGCDAKWEGSPRSGCHTSITWGLQGQGMEKSQT